jgi:Ca-activated chloride channel homolog
MMAIGIDSHNSRPQRKLTIAVCTLIALLLPLPSARAADVRAQIAEGNRLFEAGSYADALKAYDDAALGAQKEIEPELLHNRAAALFKLGRIDEAREEWVRALAIGDARYEARTRYNLGNCAYEQALNVLRPPEDAAATQPAENKPENAPPALLERAIEHYRDAIHLDPALADARANLELALQLKKKLEENQPPPSSQPDKNKQQPSTQPNSQSQPNDKQQRQPSSQPDQNQDEQNQDQQNQQNQQQQQQQNGEDQQQQNEGEGQNGNDNGSQDQQQQNASEKPGENGQGNANQNANGSQLHTVANGNSADNASGQQQQMEPRNANANGNDNSAQGEQDQPKGRVPIQMSRQQAERLLQLIRDRERQRREAIARRQAAQHRPVDKDW